MEARRVVTPGPFLPASGTVPVRYTHPSGLSLATLTHSLRDVPQARKERSGTVGTRLDVRRE